MKNMILAGILVLPIIVFSCNTTEPPDNHNGQDTTSHNYSWQKFNFGGAASSYLSDIAIVNDTLIYAVGSIFLQDSLGNPDPQPYSIVKWDGEKWELKKLFYNSTSIITSIRGILVLSPNTFWFAAGSIFQWDGISSQTQLSFSRLDLSDPNATIEKLWGNPSSILYGVGNAGTITFYQNGNWQKIESGTNTDIYDIWGGIGGMVLFSGYQEIYRITSSNKSEKIEIPFNRRIRSVWFNSQDKIYAAGDGIFLSTDMKNWKEEDVSNEYATFKIRGTGDNNIFAAGGFGFTAHFNGASWKVIGETALSGGNYESLDVKGNTVALVGFEGNAAVITIGKRIN